MEKNEISCHFEDFLVISQLGKGSFGTVYKAKYLKNQIIEKKDQTTHGKDKKPNIYAIKVQTIGAIKPMLHMQYDILSTLKQKQLKIPSIKKGYAIPQMLLFKELQYISYMAMEMLDITLQDFANKAMKNIFSKDCLIRVFYNILKIIELLHKSGYVHRDLKPANFMLKFNSQVQQQIQPNNKYMPVIYPIDLGLCKSYINPVTRKHIPCKQNKKMVGTAIFCSLNTHQGLQQSRRDDIQAIIYMVTYLVKKLPWESVCSKQGVKLQVGKDQLESPKKKQKNRLDVYEQIYRIKKTTNFDQLLNDPQLLPACLLQIQKYVRKMQFEQQPNYHYIYGLLEKEHYELTGIKLSDDNCQCNWENLNIKKQNKTEEEDDKKKKIKINFKIPTNKLKKPILHSQIKTKQLQSHLIITSNQGAE